MKASIHHCKYPPLINRYVTTYFMSSATHSHRKNIARFSLLFPWKDFLPSLIKGTERVRVNLKAPSANCFNISLIGTNALYPAFAWYILLNLIYSRTDVVYPTFQRVVDWITKIVEAEGYICLTYDGIRWKTVAQNYKLCIFFPKSPSLV